MGQALVTMYKVSGGSGQGAALRAGRPEPLQALETLPGSASPDSHAPGTGPRFSIVSRFYCPVDLFGLPCREDLGHRILFFHCVLYPFKCSTRSVEERVHWRGSSEGPRLTQIPPLVSAGQWDPGLPAPAPPCLLSKPLIMFPLGLNQVLAHPRSLFYNCWWGWARLCLQALNVPAGRSWIITLLFWDAVCHCKIVT